MNDTYKSGQATSVYDSLEVRDYFSDVHEAARRHQGHIILDAFAGGGRDIKTLYEILKGDAGFIALDADPLRISDMLQKNTPDAPDLFSYVSHVKELKEALRTRKISVIEGVFPDRPLGSTGISLKAQISLLLCNAGIMFISESDLEKTLFTLSDMLAPEGEMFLRFSLDRSDQKNNSNYHVHQPLRVIDLLQKTGLKVSRKPDLKDPQNRPFSWVDIHCSQAS